ncbi:unnamed protein product [Sphenostylis stenocarpa]|uniref:Uncharacterized protein n=1 Tax=Sphenostylis stenocarpa TaxID=92480 RepID=A0AA86W4I9_9FABA|nr:unnamed protein product [Sphenostylis stenocarpa]
MPGRPKRRRNLEAWEQKKDDSQMNKAGAPKRCSRCLSWLGMLPGTWAYVSAGAFRRTIIEPPSPTSRFLVSLHCKRCCQKAAYSVGAAARKLLMHLHE